MSLKFFGIFVKSLNERLKNQEQLISNLNNPKEISKNLTKKLNGVVNLDPVIWNQTVELQDTFNKKVIPNWKTKNLDWWMAIIDENVEILNSKSWKWWKDKNNYGDIKYLASLG